jgi:c-di-GMP-binding flagellar brake protein YcgR
MAFTADGRELLKPGAPGTEPVDLEMSVGDGLHVAFLAEQSPDDHEVRLIGWVPGRSLIVSAPERGRRTVTVEDGSAVAVRLFSGGRARGYTGTVLHVGNDPFPHLHLSYPARLDALEERRTERVRAALAASVVRAGAAAGERETAAILRDLSNTGALVFTQAPLGAKGERVEIHARLPLENLGDQAVTLPAVIRTAAEGADLKGSLWRSRCGVQFEGLNTQTTLVLRAYLYERFARG